MSSGRVGRILIECDWMLGLLITGFVATLLIGLSFGWNGEGASVSPVTVLCAAYIFVTVPLVTITFIITTRFSSLRFRVRAGISFGIGLALPILFLMAFMSHC